MIEKYLPFQFIKKSPFYGSYKEMNYRITEMHGELEVCYFEGPYSFAHTPDEKKFYQTFPYNDEGYEEAIQFLNRVYDNADYKKRMRS